MVPRRNDRGLLYVSGNFHLTGSPIYPQIGDETGSKLLQVGLLETILLFKLAIQ